jgi:hypothetical protein
MFLADTKHLVKPTSSFSNTDTTNG